MTLLFALALASAQGVFTEAPTGFDNPKEHPYTGGTSETTNGLFDDTAQAENADAYGDQEGIPDGLGPTYNAQSCGECHQNPVMGGGSQVTELRAGHRNFRGEFVDAPGGSLIHSRATDASLQEHVPANETVRTFRTSLNTLGDGFVEAIGNDTLEAIRDSQPRRMRGLLISVPVLEADGALRYGRFGWKNQHASLISFSIDAYLNEMGITTPKAPTENTSLGRSVAAFDQLADPDDADATDGVGEDIVAFANFMRATKAPPRGEITPAAVRGEALFNQVGCAICHTAEIRTAAPNTVINGGAFTVPEALGNKIIRPFSDFLLHNVGTGDGIVQNGGQRTANWLRTPPLWGVRTRNRLMHDGESLTFHEAILRHDGQSAGVTYNYHKLSRALKVDLI
jgi:CxxC motif-containing protein (DUF1111 family)